GSTSNSHVDHFLKGGPMRPKDYALGGVVLAVLLAPRAGQYAHDQNGEETEPEAGAGIAGIAGSAGIEGYLDWLTEDRVDKGGNYNNIAGSLLRAAREIENLPGNNSADGVWELIGPAPLGSGTARLSGRTNSIAIDPRNPNVVYIGAALGGVWKST